MSAAVAATLRGLVAELVAAGVRDAVVCPGSRSTPLALAVRAHPSIATRVLLDERAAGFFALGLAKASRRPVAVVVTSGTAGANLLPAAVEATLGRVPLVLLTADRPAELRDRGAPQTIDQLRLFGEHVKWFADLPLIDDAPESEAHWRSVAGRAVATALAGPAGPVHLNLPFREPLIPAGDLAPVATAASSSPSAGFAPSSAPSVELVAGPRTLDRDALAALAGRIGAATRGLIVAGPQDDPELPAALARLAAATGFPVLADPLSLARAGRHDRSRVIARSDLLLRPGPWREAHVPDLVIRFGASPTSKPLTTFLAEARPVQFVVDGDAGWREPLLLPTTFVHADPVWLASALATALVERPAGGDGRPPADPGVGGEPAPHARDGWLAEWRTADDAATSALRRWLADRESRGDLFEGAPFAHLADLLPDGAILWASSSMPVRDLDAWLPSTDRAIRPLSNRGANGIDGVVSSALGAAASGTGPVAVVVGDIAFLHDLNALVAAARHGLSLLVVLVNNDGGGIFSFLPQATADAPGVGLPAHYEELFGTPHGIDLGPLVAALGGRHLRVAAEALAGGRRDSQEADASLRAALEDGVAALRRPGVTVVELRTERGRNVALHRDAAEAVRVALEALPVESAALRR